ncbi:MAG: hypothetical protein LUC30_05885 [Clostridiales bacterium]|nr:hypothetical protein [Clostridiales bacterium]
MGKCTALIVIGAFLLVLGVLNCMGNISSVHWYNRARVSEEDIPKYGKCIGFGTGIIGGSLLATGLLELFLQDSILDILVLAGIFVGLVVMLYGQFKYNGGLF